MDAMRRPIKIKNLTEAVRNNLVRLVKFYDGPSDSYVIRYDVLTLKHEEGNVYTCEKQIGGGIPADQAPEIMAINRGYILRSLNRQLRKINPDAIVAPPFPAGWPRSFDEYGDDIR